MRWVSAASVALVVAGCSLIYNPNNLPAPTPHDAAIVDSDPTMPVLTEIAPAFIDEGQGAGGSAPALLVLRGKNLVNANLRVTLTPTNGAKVLLDPVVEARASSDFNYVVFKVTAQVDKDLAADIHVPLDVTITQDAPGGVAVSSQPLSGMLTLHGHAELKATTATTLTAPLDPTYSVVQLAGVTFNGTVPAQLHAISSITTGAISASAVAATPGPGGFAGGKTQGGGGGGGAAGTAPPVAGNGGGGGGAGFASVGSDGATPGSGGAMGGAAGHLAGNDLLVPLESNLPSAGGGGGAGSLAGGAAGGVGGAGAGVVVLVAGGDITTGDIAANGGTGGKGAAGLGSGGGGGGGAGGAVLVSSAGGAVVTGKINVIAGPGGSPGGGASSGGRVRWDAGSGSAPSSPDRPAHRGPAFMVTTRVFTTLPQRLALIGTRGDGFNVSVTDQDHAVHDGGHFIFDADNTAMITPPLNPGYNRVCITLDGGTQGHLEAEKCLDVAYLP